MSKSGNINFIVSEICCLLVPNVCCGRVGCACPALRLELGWSAAAYGELKQD